MPYHEMSLISLAFLRRFALNNRSKYIGVTGGYRNSPFRYVILTSQRSARFGANTTAIYCTSQPCGFTNRSP
jgi:hypothetical protein